MLPHVTTFAKIFYLQNTQFSWQFFHFENRSIWKYEKAGANFPEAQYQCLLVSPNEEMQENPL